MPLIEAVSTELPSRPRRVRLIDGRGKWPRRHKVLLTTLTAELSAIRKPSEHDKLKLRNACGLLVSAERQEADMLSGKPFDAEQQVRCINAAHRLLQAIGLHPGAAGEQVPRLAEYLSSGHRKGAAA